MIVLDASALLALINHEPGWEVVARAAAGEDATISAVNYSEVLQKSARVGITAEVIDGVLDELAITVTPSADSTPGSLRPSTGTAPTSAWPTGCAWPLVEACPARPTPPTGSGKTGQTPSASTWSSFADRAGRGADGADARATSAGELAGHRRPTWSACNALLPRTTGEEPMASAWSRRWGGGGGAADPGHGPAVEAPVVHPPPTRAAA